MFDEDDEPIKLSLLFSCYFVVINASEGSRFFCTATGVKFRVAAVKNCPALHFSVVIFFRFCPSG
jgi:hypothetical protein